MTTTVAAQDLTPGTVVVAKSGKTRTVTQVDGPYPHSDGRTTVYVNYDRGAGTYKKATAPVTVEV